MNQISKMVKDKKDINYDILKQIEEHVKEYERVSDKKEFLKNVGAYEQKLILLSARDPYEVLCYMEELDLPATKLILSELNYDEIMKILELFTTEDKERFYTTFSDLSLVNQFIVYDKKASEYIEDLSIDRKINLLNASDSETVLASSKVYDSISDTDKQIVASNVKTSDGLSALSSASSYIDSSTENNISNNTSKSETNDKNESEQNSDNKESSEELEEQKEETNENEKQEKLELQQEQIDYFKNNFEKYLMLNPELKNIDVNDPMFYNLLSADLLTLINADFQNFKNTQPEEINDPKSEISSSDTLESFQETKEKCEGELIQTVKNQLLENGLVDDQESITKTRTL